MSNDAIPSFSAMLRGALGDALAPDATNFVDMFAETGVMEFPFAPADGVTRLEGKPALIDYLAGLGTMVDIVRVIRLSEGRIVQYRDYWNPNVITQVMRDAETVSGSLAGGEVHGR
jgi:ketosteroid isomerase-like protein